MSCTLKEWLYCNCHVLQEPQQWPAAPPQAVSQLPTDSSAWTPGPHFNWQEQQQLQQMQQQLQQQRLARQQLEQQLWQMQQQEHERYQRQLQHQSPKEKQAEMQQQRYQADCDHILGLLMPQQWYFVSKMPHQNRQEFFARLKNKMLLSNRCDTPFSLAQQGSSALQLCTYAGDHPNSKLDMA